MRVAVDTNVLVRLFANDDDHQARTARSLVDDADTVFVAVPTLCELVWVLSTRYRLPANDIGAAIQALIDSANVVTDRPAVEAGLELLLAGGDFADGAMAYEGRRLGAEVFVSFDQQAVRLLSAAGHTARLASAIVE